MVLKVLEELHNLVRDNLKEVTFIVTSFCIYLWLIYDRYVDILFIDFRL